MTTIRCLIAVLVAACDSGSRRAPEPPASNARQAPAVVSAGNASPSSTPPAEAEPPFTGTLGIIDKRRESMPSVLTAVRVGEHPSYDRVVFEFRGELPGYHIEYIDRPVRDCGAGEPRPIAGDGWLEVRFYPANAHDEQGHPTVSKRELLTNLSEVLEVELTCDFEAVVTWVLGTKSPNRYRVLELSAPPRLAVDVRR